MKVVALNEADAFKVPWVKDWNIGDKVVPDRGTFMHIPGTVMDIRDNDGAKEYRVQGKGYDVWYSPGELNPAGSKEADAFKVPWVKDWNIGDKVVPDRGTFMHIPGTVMDIRDNDGAKEYRVQGKGYDVWYSPGELNPAGSKEAMSAEDKRIASKVGVAVFDVEKTAERHDRHVAYAVFDTDESIAKKARRDRRIAYAVFDTDSGKEASQIEAAFKESKAQREAELNGTVAAKKVVKFDKVNEDRTGEASETYHVMVEGDRVGDLEKEPGTGGQWHYFDHWPGGPFINPGPWDSKTEAQNSIKADIQD